MASSGGGTAAVWLGGADASDLLSLFRYLGFDAGGVDPAQLLAAADWAADARPHRLVRALRKLLDGAPYPVRAGVAFDDAAFRAEPRFARRRDADQRDLRYHGGQSRLYWRVPGA